MRAIVSVAAAAALLGALAGAGMGYFEARPWTAAPLAKPTVGGADVALDLGAAGGPRAAIEETTYRFGKMEQGTSMHHDFVIRNDGQAPLTLSYVSHTCKCTSVKIDGQEVAEGARTEVPPGRTGAVTLEWVAKAEAGPFRHGATFGTNDPSHARVELTVEGDVVESTTLRPSSVYFNGVRVGETREESVLVMAFIEPEVQVTAHQLTVPETLAKQMSVRVETVDPSEFPDPNVQAAARVVVSLAASGYVGPFQGSLSLETNLPQAAKLEIPVGGNVKGDVSIYGQGWQAAVGLLKLGAISGAEGGESQLHVMIRGEHADATELTVARVDPPELQATLGEPVRRGDALVQVPLTVTIPPGTRPLVRAGEDQGGEGEIVLATTHPQTGEVKLRVQFAVKP